MSYVIRHHHHLRHRLEKRSRLKLSCHFFVLMENDVDIWIHCDVLVISLCNRIDLFYMSIEIQSIQSLLNTRWLLKINYSWKRILIISDRVIAHSAIEIEHFLIQTAFEEVN